MLFGATTQISLNCRRGHPSATAANFISGRRAFVRGREREVISNIRINRMSRTPLPPLIYPAASQQQSSISIFFGPLYCPQRKASNGLTYQPNKQKGSCFIMCTHWWLQSALSSIPRLTNTRVRPNEKHLWAVNRALDASYFTCPSVALPSAQLSSKDKCQNAIHPISVFGGETAVFDGTQTCAVGGLFFALAGPLVPPAEKRQKVQTSPGVHSVFFTCE